MGRLSPQINEIPTSKGGLDPVKRWQARATQREYAWEMEQIEHEAQIFQSAIGMATTVGSTVANVAMTIGNNNRLKAESKEASAANKARYESSLIKSEQGQFLSRLATSLTDLDQNALYSKFTGSGLEAFIKGQNAVIDSQQDPEKQLAQQSQLSSFLREAQQEIAKREKADTNSVVQSYKRVGDQIGGQVRVALENGDTTTAERIFEQFPEGLTQPVPGIDVSSVNAEREETWDAINNDITIAKNKNQRELDENISERKNPLGPGLGLDAVGKHSDTEDISDLLGTFYSSELGQGNTDGGTEDIVRTLAHKGVPTSVIRDALDSQKQDGIPWISLKSRLKIGEILSRIDNERSAKATADYGNQLSTDALKVNLMVSEFELDAIATGRNTAEMDERLAVIQDRARDMLSFIGSMPDLMSSDQIKRVEATIAAVNRVSNIELTLTEQSRRIDGILYQVKDGQPFREHLLSNPGLRQTMAAEADALGIPYGHYLTKVIVSSNDDTRRMYSTLTKSFADPTLAGTGTSKEIWNKVVSEAAIKLDIRFGGDDKTEASDLQALVALAELIQPEPSLSVLVDEEVEEKRPHQFVNMTSALFRSYSPEQQERVVRGEAPGLAPEGWQPSKNIQDAVILHEMK